MRAQEQKFSAPGGNGTEYVLKWFESLDEVAERFEVSVEDILSFNGLKSESEARKKKRFRIPDKSYKAEAPVSAVEAIVPAFPVVTVHDTVRSAEPVRDTAAGPAEWKGFASLNGSPVTHMALVLPFTGEGRTGSLFDFYSGVLMAVRTLGEHGVRTELEVFDYNADGERFQREDFSKYDFVLGPVNPEQAGSVLRIVSPHSFVVSPLDQKAAGMADDCRHFIQVPVNVKEQHEDALDWLAEEYSPTDAVLVFKEAGADSTVYEKGLKKRGVPYSTISYDILQGRGIIERIEKISSGAGHIRALMASENEAFCNDAVRNLSLMTHRGMEVTLYGTSKLRSFETIEPEAFHNVNLHMSSTYFIDYDVNGLKNFLLAYRALFNCEPGPFAYQGYDICSYLISTRDTFRSDWINRLENGRYSGFQTDIRFERKDAAAGLVNTAVRRVVFEKDYQVRLLR